MTSSLPIIRYGGTRISLHWSTAICALVLWFGAPTGSDGAWLISAYFLALAVHELGHWVAARDNDVHFLDLVLFPAGGLTAQNLLPHRPGPQMAMALAGPAFNTVLAATLAGMLWLIGLSPWQDPALVHPFLRNAIIFNAAIGLVNLLPMFPFDGGRALCAFHLRNSKRNVAVDRVTQIGRIVALLFGLATLLRLLPIETLPVAALLFFLTGKRGQLAKYDFSASRQTVADAMTDKIEVARVDDSIADFISKMLAGRQKDFPVTQGGSAIGMLGRKELAGAYARDGDDVTQMGEVLDLSCPRVSPEEPLTEAIERLREHDCSAALVTRRNRLLGIVNWEGIAQAIGADSLLGPQAIPAKA